ncbi:MAG: cysteine methyltransferase [Rhodospirillaceae bacterium]|nr:cysteine methyltransferase [Rhodospirillaceae bacterium]|tara:strand:- start:18839 stop:19300 length:462 start_codon:yes stop_codon:yes gene_type:complete
MSCCLTIPTRVGLIAIYGALSITKIRWTNRPRVSDAAELQKARDQITDYFRGTLRNFDLSLNPSGTEFQLAVWERILLIPYGTTSTYGELADELRTSARAVGRACATNPIPLLIPCHRVISKKGALTGYSGGGGLQTKRLLLSFEKNQARDPS